MNAKAARTGAAFVFHQINRTITLAVSRANFIPKQPQNIGHRPIGASYLRRKTPTPSSLNLSLSHSKQQQALQTICCHCQPISQEKPYVEACNTGYAAPHL